MEGVLWNSSISPDIMMAVYQSTVSSQLVQIDIAKIVQFIAFTCIGTVILFVLHPVALLPQC